MEIKHDKTEHFAITLSKLNNPAIMTVCFKSNYQFSIMVEKCTFEGITYSEYNFDEGEEPSYFFSSFDMNLIEGDQLLEKKHEDRQAFSNRIVSLKSVGYKVIFSQAVEAEQINSLLSTYYNRDTKRSFDCIIYVASELVKNAKLFEISNFNMDKSAKACSIQTFQHYITSLSMLLTAGQRQKNSSFSCVPNDCLNLILFYTSNGFFPLSIFQTEKIAIKTRSAKCVVEEYNGFLNSLLFLGKSKASKQFIHNLEVSLTNDPTKIEEVVANTNEQPIGDTANELLVKYHLK